MRQSVEVTMKGVADLFALPCVRSINKMLPDDHLLVAVRTGINSLTPAFEGDVIVIDGNGASIVRKQGGDEVCGV